MEPTPTPVPQLIQYITDTGSIFSTLTGFFGTIMNEFTKNPVLAIGFTIFIASAVIGLVTHLSHAR